MTESNDQIAKRVIAIVAHNRAVEPSTINLQTDLHEDLGLAGDDVDDLFGELQKRLQIDFSGFQFDRHFEGEGASPSDFVWVLGGVPLLMGVMVVQSVYFGEQNGFVQFLEISFLLLAWFWLGSFVRPSIRKWNRERIPVTIADLVTAAKDKKWTVTYEGKS
jgi:Protein of unknown function (DUF1493)